MCADGFLCVELLVACVGVRAQMFHPGAEVLVHDVVPVVRRDGAGEGRSFSFGQQCAQFAIREDEDGLREDIGF